VKQTTRGFRGPLMVQSLTSAKSKFLSLNPSPLLKANSYPLLYGINGIIVSFIIQEVQLSYGLDYRICWILGTSYGVTANFAGQKLLIFNKP